MKRRKTAGPVLAKDHDRLFKKLLTTFFVEFLDLFFPQLAENLDRSSVEFLPTEKFVNLFDGAEYQADIVAKARFKNHEAYFLIHVEHQSTAPTEFPLRLFRYFSALFEEYSVPVYPIVIYSHDTPRKEQPNEFALDFPDGPVLRFHYRVVQLNRLSWRQFVRAKNPVASALMAKMKIASEERPRVKLECLRLMVTLKLDRARMRLIMSFVDAYLSLDEAEERVFQQVLEEAKLPSKQKEEVVAIVTSWERRGIEKGIEQGLEQGIEKGLETLRAVLVDVLSSRFAPLDTATVARVQQVASMEELRRLIHIALTANSLGEVGL